MDWKDVLKNDVEKGLLDVMGLRFPNQEAKEFYQRELQNSIHWGGNSYAKKAFTQAIYRMPKANRTIEGIRLALKQVGSSAHGLPEKETPASSQVNSAMRLIQEQRNPPPLSNFGTTGSDPARNLTNPYKKKMLKGGSKPMNRWGPIIDEIISKVRELQTVIQENNKLNDSSRIRYELVRNLIKMMMDDLIQNTKNNLQKYKIKFSDDIEYQKVKIVNFSDEMVKEEKKLKLFLKNKMYLHPRIRTMTIKAKKIISDLFNLFIEEPTLMPDNWSIFQNNKQKHINVCDYISGMTDNFAINTHRKFFDLYSF